MNDLKAINNNCSKLHAIAASLGCDSSLSDKYDDTDEALRQRAAKRNILKESERQRNIEDVLKAADANLRADSSLPVSEEMIDRDWLNRLIDYAQDVSDSEMKMMWSKILAGEIRHPKSFSLRTMEALRNLTKEDAALITRFASLTICDVDTGDRIIVHDDEDKSSLRYDEVLYLCELGILTVGNFLAMSWSFDEEKADFSNVVKISNGNIGINIYTSMKDFSLSIHSVTKIGNQIFSLIDNVAFDTDYYQKVLKKALGNNRCVCGHIHELGDARGFVFSDEIFRIENQKVQ